MTTIITRDEIRDIIYQSLDALNEQLSDDRQMARAPATVLVGGDGGLDSLGFVNLVSILEERLEPRIGVLVFNPNDSFETVQDLIDLIHAKVVG